MYVPDVYRVEGDEWPRRVIAEHALATLTTNGPEFPHATHLPSLLAPGTPGDAPLVGAELLGHMNRANPHWRALAPGAPALMVFQGPGAYVTPAVYHVEPAAPTWDFVSVHVRGRLRPVQDREETLRIILATVAHLEGTVGDTWDPTPSLGYFRRILPGVGAFRLEIQAVDAMFKLSQEKDDEVRQRVVDRFEDGDGRHRGLAELIRVHGGDACGREAQI
ncbi:FMN-binding negative transcriptional regulator [Streptomyces sp. NPDC001828]|uniref:FMN-binding negative transcriptional regulator n=1 Tax=Streptomyces sp. NPDC001828 TaxID=3364615 RepID=UPI0036D06C18